MVYFAAMAMLVPTVALLAASLSANAGAPAQSAIREDGGSSVTVSARIIRASARVGAAFGPPLPRMVPRRTTVGAADGRPVAALVYDFE